LITFRELGLSSALLESIHSMGFEETTPIQEKTIPIALNGNDLLGQAQTGTGKTAAFGIPLVEKTSLDIDDIQGLVITPTRELAVQVAEELNRIGHHKQVRALPIYGGQDIDRQIRSLKKHPQIIVGTPGRLQDHIRRRTIRLEQIQIVVLDEADEMLNMGFIEDIEMILSKVPAEHQTLLFSATMPPQIKALAGKFMNHPQEVKIKVKEVTLPTTEQIYIEMSPKQKFDALCNLLDIQSPELAIIFGRTKKRVDELTEALNKRGYSADAIHGDLSQSQRDTVIRRFKEGSIDIMVATDVAARGLDISGVTHVYNFDIPQDPESYVHRIGRTGRAGRTGTAITLVHSREMELLRSFERVTKKKMKREAIPTIHEAMEGQQRQAIEKLLKVIAEEDFHHYKELAMQLLEETDSVTLLSAALKMMVKEPNKTPVQITEQGFAIRERDRNRSRRNQDRVRGDDRRKKEDRGKRDRDRGKRGKSEFAKSPFVNKEHFKNKGKRVKKK
jgi:ATP-dependent RNA helicase DeaD